MADVVSIVKARELLGTQAASYSDDQVQELVNMLTLLAKESLWYNGSKDTEDSNESTGTIIGS